MSPSWRACGLGLMAALWVPGAVAAEPSDAEFVAKAASGGRMEVELGKHAAKNAADPAVREFGERMVKDHGAASERLKAAAQQAGIPVPSALQPKHRETLEELSALRGAEFDRRYMEAMVDDHDAEVAEFKRQAEGGDSPIDRWAEQTLPTLEEHLSHAQRLAKGSASGAADELP